jgi:dihydropyrimidinase
MRTLISHGLVVNPDGCQDADVLIDGETIAAVLPRVMGSADRAPGDRVGVRAGDLGGDSPVSVDRVIDARGRLVIPGAIDPHTHMQLPVAGTVSRDTFETGSRAAAFGGTTTIIDYAGQTRGRPLREGLDAWMARAEGQCAIDYGFHMMVNDVNEATLAEMDAFVAEGVTTFKLFTAYPGVQLSDDGAILRAMLRSGENGGLVLMHAENGVAIDVLAERQALAGHTDPWYHGVARHAGLEAECVARVIRLAEAAAVPVYVVHLSSRDALEEVVRGRQRGARAFAETCPQYLFLTLDQLGDGFDGARYVCSPPLRSREHHAALWRGLAEGDLQVVGTDHCPFDFRGQKELGRGDFRRIPNGLPGVEERLDLLHQGVLAGHLSRERWVEVCSTAAARMFGLSGRKGAIAVGLDADVVVYDPQRRHTLSAATQHSAVDYSCYEGLEVQGGSDLVISRGRVIVEDGRYLGRPGDGRFLARQPSLESLGA